MQLFIFLPDQGDNLVPFSDQVTFIKTAFAITCEMSIDTILLHINHVDPFS